MALRRRPAWFYAVYTSVRRIRPRLHCVAQVLVMPMACHLVQLLKGLLPIEVCRDLLDWFGILESMDDFKGRAREAYPVGSRSTSGKKQA